MVESVTGGSPANALAAQANTANQKAMAGGDFETFLRMLTAQLKNQDPLNPMEGSDFAVQLATFSGVEQQAQTNSLLQQLTQQMGGGLGQLSGWIGKEVRTTGPVWFGAEAMTLDVAPDPRADSVQLIAMTSSGRELTREEIGPGDGQIDWYGRDAAGNKLADGLYTFRIESWQDGKLIANEEVGAYARVIEAEMGRQGVQLVLSGGATVLADDVEALREAPTETPAS